MILRSQNQQFFFKDQRGLPNLIYRTPLNTEANKNYFVRQNIKFGVFVGGSSIHEVSAEKGMEDVKKCELIESQRKESVNINPADIEKARAELKAQQ